MYLVHLKVKQYQTLRVVNYIYRSKWVDCFWLVKALSGILRDGQNYSKNQSKMSLCAHLGQQSKQAVDWDDPTAVYLSSSIFQSPAFSWGRSELTDRNVELYPQFFSELITTQLRFYMVSPQLSLLIILTMQSYKFYLGSWLVLTPTATFS